MARIPGNPTPRGPASGLNPEDVDMAVAEMFKPDNSAKAYNFGNEADNIREKMDAASEADENVPIQHRMFQDEPSLTPEENDEDNGSLGTKRTI